MLCGFDVSNWQSGLDVSTLPADFLILKASQALSFKDKCFDGFRSAWATTGKPWGAYHFLTHGNVVDQAANFRDVTRAYEGSFVPVVDVEAVSVTSDDVTGFVSQYHEATGVWPWVYTSASMVSKFTTDDVRAHCGLWVAGYRTNNPRSAFPSGTTAQFPYSVPGTVAAWQFTSRFSVSGGRLIDASVFYGDEGTWRDYARGDGAATPVLSGNMWHAARQVIRGEFGNGEERKAKITAAGGNYDVVQSYVYWLLNASADWLATYVIRGEMGVGTERKYCLAGRYDEVQKAVNRRLKK